MSEIKEISEKLGRIKSEIAKEIFGQDDIIKHIIIALFSNGHVLLEGVPGLGKTKLAHALSRAIGGDFKRIQFTPDLMPADITGTSVFNTQRNVFEVKKGPVFTNILLADEINRTPAKTQSALLQAMQERTVNIDGENYPLPESFLCIATQNPIEMEGTYPLPEAQLDRFMMKITVSYPEFVDEEKILRWYREKNPADDFKELSIDKIINTEDFRKIQDDIRNIKVDDSILHYIVEIVSATRTADGVEIGASPRGGVALLQCAKTFAAFEGRDFVVPDDIKSLSLPVLRHRLILEPEAEMEGIGADDVLFDVLSEIKVPR